MPPSLSTLWRPQLGTTYTFFSTDNSMLYVPDKFRADLFSTHQVLVDAFGYSKISVTMDDEISGTPNI